MLSGALSAAKTPDELAQVLVERGVEALEATSGSFARPSGNELEHVARGGQTPASAAHRRTFSTDLASPAAIAFRTRSAQWIESPEDLQSHYPDAAAGSAAGCALPLVLGDRVCGVLTFRFVEPRTFTPAERAFMETFVLHAAQALDRAEVYAREVQARRRLEALGALAEDLSSALTVDDVARVVVDRGMKAEAADTCMIYTFDEQTTTLDLIGDRGCNPELVELLRRLGPESGNPVHATVVHGGELWVETEEEYARLFPTLAKIPVEEPRARAFWSIPLIAEGKAVGLLAMGFYRPRRFPPEERVFVETFTRHCAEALLRARRLDVERGARTVAETLQARLATTLRSIGDAVIATDADGLVTIMNPIAEMLTGWTEREARGRPLDEVFEIIHEQTREPIPSPVDRVLAQGAVVGLANHSVLVQRSTRREIPIDDSGAPIRRDPGGATQGIVLVFRDVTAKKREEARSALLEAATTALTESLDYEITLAEVARLAVPRLADWCTVDVLEEPSAACVGRAAGRRRPWKQLAVAHIDPAKAEFARELGRKYPPDPDATLGIPNVLRTGKSEIYPRITDEILRARAIDEEHLRISLGLKLRSAMIVPLIARGRTLGAMTYVWAESEHTYTKDDLVIAEELAHRCAIAIDNARLYAAEQRARQAADVANRAKDEFLATVSHELRTPLNAIMGWAKMLSSGVLDESKRVRAVDTIDRNAVAMAQLIEDLLDISRIISGKMRLEVQPVDLARVIEAAIESIKPAADAKEIRVNAVLDTSREAPLMGDPTRLQQVVWNLLSNAVKFTSKGGRIDVVLRTTNSEVEIAVTDTGKGIDRHFLPHVFDPFRQEDASHTRSRGGLGLGLAITRQLVELHGGRIEARSEGEGRGSCFLVRLPMAAVSMASRKGSRHPRQIRIDSTFDRPKQLRGVRALVVDDEEDARLLVKAVLEECGCHVILAASAKEGISALATDVPDVLISDIGMPNEDGYDFMRHVRALPAERGGNIPAAALTAYARAEDRRRVLGAGYSMHIPKPVEPAELVAVVVSLTRFSQRLSS
jgi:PAS domain S-box-containing protein